MVISFNYINLLLHPIFFLFFLSLIFRIILVLSRNSWFLIWLGLEINLLSFVAMIFYKKSKYRTEAALKYFLIQIIRSIIIVVGFMFLVLINELILFVILRGLIIKLGSAPFHQWLPSLIEGLSWNIVAILLILQKVNPILLLFYLVLNRNISFVYFIYCSSLIGAIRGLNQISLRKLVAYSSISHLAWLLARVKISFLIILLYLIFYSLILTRVIVIFDFNQSININFIIKRKRFTIISSIGLLSLRGLPPLIGFFPKLIVRQEIILIREINLLIILLFSTFLRIFFYIRFILTSLIFSFSKNYLFITKTNNRGFLIINLLIILIYPVIL